MIYVNSQNQSSTPQSVMSMRSFLVQNTQALHDKLHNHEIFDLTSNIENSTERLRQIHQAFWMFYSDINRETQSLSWLSDYCLDDELEALRASVPPPQFQPYLSSKMTREYGLGLLYVAHGTAFGKSTLLKLVQEAFGVYETPFLTLRPNVLRWKGLIQDLESLLHTPNAHGQILMGAETGFKLFGLCADRALHSH